MKIFIAALLIASVASSPRFESRIGSGVDAKDGQAKCYVTLVIEGENTGVKNCGGCLIVPEERIVTSASCVMSASEGKATSIKVYPGLKGPSGMEVKNEILDIYPFAEFSASNNLSRGDVAMITFADRFKTVKDKFEAAVLPSEDKADAYVGQNLFVCGFGNTDNKKSKPKTLQCTTLRVVPSAVCDALMVPAPAPGAAGETTTTTAATTSTGPATAKKGLICTKNLSDKNVCGGDLGAPVYSNVTGMPTLVGVVSLYPDTRPNARCLDGHHVVITQLGVYKDFLNDPTKPPATTVAPTAAP